MRTTIPGFLILAAGLWVTPADTQAAIYQWTDENGQVHFTDQPPPKARRKEVEVEDTNAIGPSPSIQQRASQMEAERRYQELDRERQRELDHYRERRQMYEERADKAHDNYLQGRCNRYKDRIADAREELRRGYTSDRGAELRRRIERAERDAARYCQ